jgi:CheY-like chemotaxis protein
MTTSPPILVLLADDDEDDRLIFREALEQTGLNVKLTLMHNGVQLMDYLEQQKGKELPHILFLDLNMPLKGGIECLKEIREDEVLQNLSVAIYSTSASEDDIENTFIEGANVYIKKPNDFNRLVKVLDHVITVNWQYHTSDLNKANFVLSV